MFLNTFTTLLFICWILYWRYEAYKADKEKPKQNQWSVYKFCSWIFTMAIFLLVFMQLFGFPLLPYKTSSVIQIGGVLIVLVGMAVSISARKVLSTNWANAYEYQIKQKHELITSGAYHYIRHPIYTGMIVSFIGAEIVVGSLLWISFLGLFLGAYIQAKREEKILQDHFGKTYTNYMKHSKMLIPFIF